MEESDIHKEGEEISRVVVESGNNKVVEETSLEEEESGIHKEGEGISPAAAVNDSNTVVEET